MYDAQKGWSSGIETGYIGYLVLKENLSLLLEAGGREKSQTVRSMSHMVELHLVELLLVELIIFGIVAHRNLKKNLTQPLLKQKKIIFCIIRSNNLNCLIIILSEYTENFYIIKMYLSYWCKPLHLKCITLCCL